MKSTWEEFESDLVYGFQDQINKKIFNLVINDDELLDEVLVHPIYSKAFSWLNILGYLYRDMNYKQYNDKFDKYVTNDLRFIAAIIYYNTVEINRLLTTESINLIQSIVELYFKRYYSYYCDIIISTKYMSENIEKVFLSEINCFSLNNYKNYFNYIKDDSVKLTKVFKSSLTNKKQTFINYMVENYPNLIDFNDFELLLLIVASNYKIPIKKVPVELEAQFVQECIKNDNSYLTNLLWPNITFTKKIIDIILESKKVCYILWLVGSVTLEDSRLAEFLSQDENKYLTRFFSYAMPVTPAPVEIPLTKLNLATFTSEQILALDMNKLVSGDKPAEEELTILDHYCYAIKTKCENPNVVLFEKFKSFTNWHSHKKIATNVLNFFTDLEVKVEYFKFCLELKKN